MTSTSELWSDSSDVPSGRRDDRESAFFDPPPASRSFFWLADLTLVGVDRSPGAARCAKIARGGIVRNAPSGTTRGSTRVLHKGSSCPGTAQEPKFRSNLAGVGGNFLYCHQIAAPSRAASASAGPIVGTISALDFPAGEHLLVEAADSITPSSRPNSGWGGAASIAKGRRREGSLGDFALLASSKYAILQPPAFGYSAAGINKSHGRISR